jgi:hypothetical protein
MKRGEEGEGSSGEKRREREEGSEGEGEWRKESHHE